MPGSPARPVLVGRGGAGPQRIHGVTRAGHRFRFIRPPASGLSRLRNPRSDDETDDGEDE